MTLAGCWNGRPSSVAVAIAAAVLAGLTVSCAPPRPTPTPAPTRDPDDVSPPCSGGHYLEPPNLARLIEDTDAILEGTITSIGERVWYEPPPTPGPTPTYDRFLPRGIVLGGFAVFYEVAVGAVYRGGPALSPGGHVTIGVAVCGESPCDPEIGPVGGAYMFFLERFINDDKYSVSYAPSGRLLLGDGPIRYARYDGCPVPFAAGMSAGAFRRAVRDEVARQERGTITPVGTNEP